MTCCLLWIRMLKMQLRNRPGDLCAFRPLGAQRKTSVPYFSDTVQHCPLNVGIKSLVVVLRIWFRLAWDTRVQLSLVLPFDPQSLVVAGVGLYFFPGWLLSFKVPQPLTLGRPLGRRETARSLLQAPTLSSHGPPLGCKRAAAPLR